MRRKLMPPLEMFMPQLDQYGAGPDPKSRYTRLPNPDLVHNQTVSCASTEIRKPRIADGCSFVEPMAGQGFNDQFPYGR
jgi:hypothetical protein